MSTLVTYVLLSLPLVGAYSLLSIGIVVVFRASRVLNLAHGAMAMFPAYVTYEMVRRGVPLAGALPLGVASGALLGAGVERAFVRPLARQGPTAQTVGTVAVYGLVVALAAQLWGSGSLIAPQTFPAGGMHVGGAVLRWGQLGLFAVGLVCAALLMLLFRFTGIGLAMRAAAENGRAASLMGVNPQQMARLAWMLGGALAALAGILLSGVTSLQPYSLSLQMLPAFVAALIGGFASPGGAVLGSAVVGVAQGIVPWMATLPLVGGIMGQTGVTEVVLTLVAVLVMSLRGSRLVAGETRTALGGSTATAPLTAFDVRRLRTRSAQRRGLNYVLLAVLVAWPLLGVTSMFGVSTYSLLGAAILAAEYFVIAASIVMLTGWVGQISLSQASFVGVSAFACAKVAQGLGIGFPATILVGALAAGLASALLGVVALRVRGLYLAVATLIFAWMADQYLFVASWFTGVGGSVSVQTPSVGRRGTFPYFDFGSRSTVYLVMLAACAAILYALSNLRDSRTGRAFAAVRGSEMAAASLGIDVVRYKLVAFALAGAIAGVAGSLILTHEVTVVPAQFSLSQSLFFLAVAVVGGLRSLPGAAVAAVLFGALSELFFEVPALGEYLQLTSAAILAVVLVVYPGGLAAVPGTLRRPLDRAGGAFPSAALRRRLAALVARRPALPRPSLHVLAPHRAAAAPQRRVLAFLPQPATTVAVATTEAAGDPEAALHEVGSQNTTLSLGERFHATGAVLEAGNVTVRFGGVVAVDDASLTVRAGQVVGLIGPNGAGKTTLFNAISGLNQPASGRIHLFGDDVTSLSVHRRAAAGLGRTFQIIQLFPELTVFENLMVATHLQTRTHVVTHMLVTPGGIRAELRAEETCRRVVRFLSLQQVADQPVAGLPFGVLRQVELGRALVTGAPVLMLDEPASGLDNAETDRFAELLLYVRDQLGVSILLIEHDVRMVTAVTDYMYVLNRGRMLAQGTPAQVRANPDVIAAYLGSAPVQAEAV
jgi:ABC-type branched-subunit amino acid transport system ATPase component/branched-subunit amino acid ABC-type transport system permease component